MLEASQGKVSAFTGFWHFDKIHHGSSENLHTLSDTLGKGCDHGDAGGPGTDQHSDSDEKDRVIQRVLL